MATSSPGLIYTIVVALITAIVGWFFIPETKDRKIWEEVQRPRNRSRRRPPHPCHRAQRHRARVDYVRQRRDQLVGLQTVGVAVDHRRQHQLVGLGAVEQLGQAARAVSGLPMTWSAWRVRIISRSSSLVRVVGGFLGRRHQARPPAGASAGRTARSGRRASARARRSRRRSTATATIAYGSCRSVDGRNVERYRRSAGSVLCGLK